MARPSKEQQKKLKEIISTGLVNRDSEVYLSFENKLSKLSKYQKPYIFCLACETRNIKKDSEYLEKINKRKYLDWVSHLLDDDYFPISLVPISTVWESLEEKRYNEIENDCDFTMGFMRFESLKEKLTKGELEEIIYHSTEDHTFDIKTIIRPHKYNLVQPYFKQGEISKKVLVEIDFTKPLGDIEETIRAIKEKFDSDPSYIKSPFEVLDENIEPFMCSIEECEIFKHKSPKPLEGKMADLLFIYDCKVVGLSEKYITDEITKYWKNTKKISTEEFYSFDSYFKQAKELIDKEQYKCFLHGVKTDLFDNYPY
ncbi:hypothetical protein [Poseidonibacter sp.]|uniref:hypothetical protein n=1 Tax=Poseidonibacter sp. TaxID=2321188 RepID=UPI003C74AD18